MVTCLSCIASKSADCTLAGARLISSAKIKLANIGPLRGMNLPSEYTMVPVKSPGRRSGVNWMRLNSVFTASDNVLTAKVLASPGTPSIRI